MTDMNLYGSIFSEVYNLYWTEFIDIIAPQIIELYKSLEISETSSDILDLCCGTGRLSKKLLEHNDFTIVGVDKSRSMLQVAYDKLDTEINAGKVELINEDVVEYKPNKKYGLIVSTFDSLNHMESIDDLKTIFKTSYEALYPGGLLIFDLNTTKGLKNWNFVDFEETEDLVLIFHGEYNRTEKKAYSKVYGFHKQEDNCWKKFEEVMSNTVFKLSEVSDILYSIGFDTVYFTEELDLTNVLREPENYDRVFIVSIK